MGIELKNNNEIKQGLKQSLYRDKKQLIERSIQISRVTKVTKGGKRFSFRAVVVVGDQNGKVGLGIGKADEISDAIRKAKISGLKHSIQVPVTKGLSISHNVSGHFGSCNIIMRPGVEGSGVIAGGAVRIVLEIAGIKNIIAKQLGSNNLLNNARATIIALEDLIKSRSVLKTIDHNNVS